MAVDWTTTARARASLRQIRVAPAVYGSTEELACETTKGARTWVRKHSAYVTSVKGLYTLSIQIARTSNRRETEHDPRLYPEVTPGRTLLPPGRTVLQRQVIGTVLV